MCALQDGQYRVIVLDRIIDICSKDHYAFVGDFEWYVETLVELTHVQGMVLAVGWCVWQCGSV